MEPINDFGREVEIQKRIAFYSGLLQGDITIKTLLESLAEGVVIVNEDGRIVLINHRMAQLTGYDKNEVVGHDLNIFISQNKYLTHSHYVKNFFNDPRIRPMGIGLELSAQRKDGSTFPVEISLSFLITETEKLGIGFITDITARKQAEEELKKRNVELDAYAHTVAHDLNSSLQGIIGYSEFLVDSDQKISADQYNSFLKEISKSGRKMSTIIRELLVFASMKKEDIELEEIITKEILANVLQRLRYQIEEKSAQIIINDNILNCKGYAPWIEEVFYNYVSNAIKYGGSPPLIEIYSEKLSSGEIKYNVKDNGEGISNERKSIIFEERGARTGLTKGFGLGLSIVRRIIEKLDGNVSVESECGKGTIFSFSLRNE
jgi:PAS domain S-box-containing protein